MKSILIIGQGPSKSGEGRPPLEGQFGSGKKLAELSGVTIEKMHELADCVNLLDSWHGSNGKGDHFPMKLAREKAPAVQKLWQNYERVVLLGSNVAEAFRFESEPLTWQKMEDCSVAIMPHPSGVNRWWNDEQNKADAAAFLRSVFEDCKVPDSDVLIRKKEARAKFCTEYVERFDKQLREWWQVAEVLHEVERDQLFLEVECKSFNEWLRKHAPTSYSFCYAARKRFLSLKEHVPMEDLKQIPSETADWASKAKNISPAALKRPEVIEALKNPKKKAIEALQIAAPDEHVEHTHNFLAKFSASQYNMVMDGHEAYRALVDDKAGFEDFVESLVSDWFDSAIQTHDHAPSCTVRDAWQVHKGTHDQAKEKTSAAVVAAL